jgi:PhoH-like ATPase
MAWSICMDPAYVIKVIRGEVGTGKSMIAVLSALQRVANGEFPGGLIYTRPPAPKQFDLGFLPGDESEKFAPWVQAFWDQAELFPSSLLKRLSEDGLINFVPIDKIKGRTFRGMIVIVDEAQDCTETTMECLVGRPGDGSELIIIGDPRQVDAPGCTPEKNGLIHLDLIDDQPDVAIVNLVKPERGRAAELSLLLSRRRTM